MAKAINERVENWEAQIRKGSLELAILASLWNKRLYGLEILRIIGDSSLGLSEGTLYLILNRLRADKLVNAEWVDAGSGHPRKYYVLTDSGIERLEEMAHFWDRFSSNLNALTKHVLSGKEIGHARLRSRNQD